VHSQPDENRDGGGDDEHLPPPPASSADRIGTCQGRGDAFSIETIALAFAFHGDAPLALLVCGCFGKADGDRSSDHYQ
jgi:hypothetical protein